MTRRFQKVRIRPKDVQAGDSLVLTSEVDGVKIRSVVPYLHSRNVGGYDAYRLELEPLGRFIWLVDSPESWCEVYGFRECDDRSDLIREAVQTAKKALDQLAAALK